MMLTDLTIAGMKAGLAAREFSAVELTEAHLDAMAAARALNAFIVETPEIARAQAAAADAALAKGEARPLTGIPLGIKDLFCTQGVQTTAGSNILKGFIPQYESTVSGKLLADGAVMLGKLNMDEFAMGSSNETSAYGKVISPWKARNPDGTASNRELVPGGSSGGSASAVAARIVAGATGTDTGGSIRQPASFVGISGIKPTYGRCSRWGVVAFASSLDQAGPMARTVEDCAIMLTSMCGYDAKDSTSLNLAVPDFAAGLTGSLKGKRVGVPKEYRLDGMDATIAKLWDQGLEWLKAAGATVVDVSLPHTRYALPVYYIIAPAEASSNLARYDGVRYGLRVTPPGGNLADMYSATRAAGFGKEVQRRIMIGTYVLSAGFYDAYYTQAQKVRTLIAQDFEKAWEVCDLLLTPTAPSAAFAFGDKADPLAMYLNDVFTVPASLAGLPAMSVPAGLSADGLPLGLQIIGRPLDEAGVLDAGLAIERAAGFSARPDPLR
jgi:aspartyl-tRNA(Asn)/glutamyl-tRNA(Gln) amidotransferase subunit A